MHWAGTVCVGRGELEITFEELLDAMHASRQQDSSEGWPFFGILGMRKSS